MNLIANRARGPQARCPFLGGRPRGIPWEKKRSA
jgi:hypothetical protein